VVPFDEDRPAKRPRHAGTNVRSGGARPAIAPQAPAIVAFAYAAGGNAVILLVLILVATMMLSYFMNNAATAAVICPVAIARQLG
jgi:hypothetical protein